MDQSLEVLTTEEIADILKDVINKHGIEKYDFKISKGAEKGDGYCSCVIKVDVKGENKNISLIIKCAPKNPTMRSMMPLNIIYSREIYMYDAYFPAIMKFQEENNIEQPFSNLPKCYKTNAEEMNELLVLENVKDAGFKLWNRKQYMPEDHIVFVFQQYGKFHGTCFALQDQKREYFKTLEVNLQEFFTEENAPPGMFEQFYSSIDKLRDIFDPEKENEYYMRASKLRDQGEAFFKEMLVKPSDYSVVCHGDCWCNNMMFAYEDIDNPTKPTKLCLLDFQLSKIASPVHDLSYFFYVSADAKMMENLEYYLKIYYQSLSDHVRALGSDPDKLFTFENLMSEWKKYSIFGFMSSTVVFKAMLRDEEEIFDLSDLKENENVMDIFNKDSKSDAFVNKRIKDVLLHMFKRNFVK